MSKIPYIILLGSMLIFSSCITSDLDFPEGWDGQRAKSFISGWMIGCKTGVKTRGVTSKDSKKAYCDCLFEAIMKEYPNFKSFSEDLDVYLKKPFYKKAGKECHILLEE